MSRSLALQELVSLLEYNLRGADVTREDLARVCAEARERAVASICVNGSRLIQAAHWLEDSAVKTTCSVAFPFGASDADVKRYETEVAIDAGAHFVEIVANLGRLKDGDDGYVLREFRDVVEAADERPVSIYLNTLLLTPDEIRRASALAAEAEAKGITLAGGLNPGTSVEALKLVREAAGDRVGIKMDQDSFEVSEIVDFLNAGATRFGVLDATRLLESLG